MQRQGLPLARSYRTDDGVYVRLLREAGFIPFARTNVPQSLMVPETDNAIFGRTDNPWDAARTPGGSSGGEGAILGSGCSVVGLGTDIGGSSRIHAHFCGVVGFKPTAARHTVMGMWAPRLGGRRTAC